jgi:hypothetical protein
MRSEGIRARDMSAKRPKIRPLCTIILHIFAKQIPRDPRNSFIPLGLLHCRMICSAGAAEKKL